MASAVAGGIANLAGSIFQGFMNDAINERNIEVQYDMMHQNQKYNSDEALKSFNRQKELSQNQQAYAIQGLKSQGLNPAYANGGFGSPSTNTPTASSSPSSVPSSIPFDNMGAGVSDILANIALKRAQADNLESQTEANEIANKRAKAFDVQIGKLTSYTSDPETGQKIDDVDQWQKDHPGKLPNLVVSNMNKGDLDALDSYSRYVSAKDVRELQAFVARSQQLDPDVRDALVKLPAKQFAKLAKEVSILSKEFEIKGNELTISAHNSKIAEYDEELKRLGLEDYKLLSPSSLWESINDPNRGAAEKFLLGIVFVILHASKYR